MKEKVENEGQEDKSSLVCETSLPGTVMAMNSEPWLSALLGVAGVARKCAASKRAVAHSGCSKAMWGSSDSSPRVTHFNAPDPGHFSHCSLA